MNERQFSLSYVSLFSIRPPGMVDVLLFLGMSNLYVF
jgi:hypothetical protein